MFNLQAGAQSFVMAAVARNQKDLWDIFEEYIIIILILTFLYSDTLSMCLKINCQRKKN